MNLLRWLEAMASASPSSRNEQARRASGSAWRRTWCAQDPVTLTWSLRREALLVGALAPRLRPPPGQDLAWRTGLNRLLKEGPDAALPGGEAKVAGAFRDKAERAALRSGLGTLTPDELAWLWAHLGSGG